LRALSASTLIATALAAVVLAAAQTETSNDPPDVIRRSVEMNEVDWRAEPVYDHCERDDDGDTARTYDVTMIDGTPYKRLIAVKDQPLPASRALEEQRKFEQVAADRRNESPARRRKRLAAYQETHARIRRVFEELARAFTFSAAGRRDVDGRDAYVINAKPRPDYEAPSRDTMALTGMNATFWIDPNTYQWIKVTGVVTRVVSIVGFHLVRVQPGTTIEIEKAPVDTDIWLTSHLQVRSSSRILLFVPHHTFYDERDFDYRRGSAHTSSTCAPNQ
jgi:hypothetical protein